MKRNSFWVRYAVVAVLIVGGVYVVTADFGDSHSLLSVQEMQQIRGTHWSANHSCQWTLGCSDSPCDTAIPPYISSVPYGILRCFSDAGEYCNDFFGPENVKACEAYLHNSSCSNPSGPYITWTHQCDDQPG